MMMQGLSNIGGKYSWKIERNLIRELKKKTTFDMLQ